LLLSFLKFLLTTTILNPSFMAVAIPPKVAKIVDVFVSIAAAIVIYDLMPICGLRSG
jgi:hypothetical protein